MIEARCAGTPEFHLAGSSLRIRERSGVPTTLSGVLSSLYGQKFNLQGFHLRLESKVNFFSHCVLHLLSTKTKGTLMLTQLLLQILKLQMEINELANLN